MSQQYLPREDAYVRELIGGSEEAFEVIYTFYSAPVYRKILGIVKSVSVADELLQDVFLKIWQVKGSIDPEKNFHAYLFKIAENKVFDHLRSEGRQRLVTACLQQRQTETYTHVEEKLADKEDEKKLHYAIASLPAQRKEIFRLCKLEGRSYKEVSGRLSISTATISDHIVKANHHIRKFFMQRA